MTEPIDFAKRTGESDAAAEENDQSKRGEPTGKPSNDVYARVGDTVLRAAEERVKRGMRPEDIIRELVTQYDVRLNVSELRLLLASRRIPE